MSSAVVAQVIAGLKPVAAHERSSQSQRLLPPQFDDATESVVLGNTLSDSVLLPFFQALRDNATAISAGASPNVLSPAVVTAVTQILSALGDGGPSNTILSKNAKTK